MELKYLCHFSQIGDVKECKGKEVIWYEECQLEGLKLETEGISISIFSKNSWSKWENNGEYLGTKGEKTPLSAIRMRTDTKEYDVFYRVSIKHIGWSAWSKNGEVCGSESAHSIINGIQILTFLKNENLAQKLQEAECFLEKYKKIKANLFVRNKEKLLRACTRDYYLGEETTQIIENGYILPLKKIESGTRNGQYVGGVIDKNHKFISGFERKGLNKINYTCLDGYDFEQENVLDLNETLIFGGVILKHFGHLMTECLSRLWFILENEKYQNTKIGVLTLPNQEDFIFDFFRLCGIERERIVIITSILHVKKVVVPEQSVELWRGYRSKYTSIYEYMAKKAGRKSYKKIFLTRTAFSKKDSVNEEFFDTFYKKREYEIVSPEKFSIEEQIAYIAGADEIVCTEGTLSHLSLFAKEGAKVIIFRRDDDVCLIPQMIVNQAKNLDITYIDTTFNFLPTKHNDSCYFYGVTSEFIDYLIAAGIEYSEEEVKFEIDKYCYEYIKLWCKNYNIKKNFNDISEYDLVDILNRMNRVFGCSKLSRKEFITKDKKREANLKEQIKEYQKEIELLKESEAVR